MTVDVQVWIENGNTPWPWPRTLQIEVVESTEDELPYAEFTVKVDGAVHTYRHFDSVVDFCSLRTHPANAAYKLDKDRNAYLCSKWYGVPSLQDALRVCDTETWPEGVARMQRELDLMLDIPPPRSIKRRATWSDQGDSLDIHKVYSGQLDTAWRKTSRRARPASQSIVLIAPMTISRHEHADKAFWCGAAIIKLCDVLMQVGYNVSIIGMHSTRSAVSRNRAFDSVTMKKADAPLDLGALVTSLAFAGFMRTKAFISINSLPWQVGDGANVPMGYHADYEEQLIAKLNLPMSSVLKGVEDHVADRPSAIAWITQQLKLLDIVHLEAQS